MDEEASKICVINTTNGLFKVNRLQMGLKNGMTWKRSLLEFPVSRSTKMIFWFMHQVSPNWKVVKTQSWIDSRPLTSLLTNKSLLHVWTVSILLDSTYQAMTFGLLSHWFLLFKTSCLHKTKMNWRISLVSLTIIDVLSQNSLTKFKSLLDVKWWVYLVASMSMCFWFV